MNSNSIYIFIIGFILIIGMIILSTLGVKSLVTEDKQVELIKSPSHLSYCENKGMKYHSSIDNYVICYYDSPCTVSVKKYVGHS